MSHQVFISHATPDQGIVETEIIPTLESFGLTCWYSRDRLTSGDFQPAILDAIQQSDWFLVVLSTQSVESNWVKAEVHEAMDTCRNRIIPILVEECKPSSCHLQLGGLHQIFWYQDSHSAKQTLRQVVQSSAANVDSSRVSAGDPGLNLIDQLRIIRDTSDQSKVVLVFRCLANEDAAIRDRARQAMHAIGWQEAARAILSMSATLSADDMTGILDGLAALESHADVVQLLDQLSNQLSLEMRNRAILLWERKQLSLRLEKLSQTFQRQNSPLRLEKVLGQGLTASTFLAKHAYMGEKQIVVRMLRPEIASRPDLRLAFLQLTERACEYVHENLVVVRDNGQFAESQMFFSVRDYIPGSTLQDLFNQGKALSPAQICRVVQHVAFALRPIHERGQTHLAVKPSNIFLTEQQRTILGDPGLPVGLLGHDLQRMVYDFQYSAPENFTTQKPAEPTADFYSLGCVFYQLACGKAPFVSDSPFGLASAHSSDDRPCPSENNSVFGTEADKFIAWLLKPSPEDRPQKIDDIIQGVQDLEQRIASQRTVVTQDQMRDPEPWQSAAPMHSIAGFQNPGDVFHSQSEPPAPSNVLPAFELSRGGANLENFLNDLAKSQLFLPKGLEALKQQLAEADPSDDAWPFARQLVREGKLTEYQANALYQGYPDRLILGNYVILDIIGRGGMGMVFHAKHQRMQRDAALKILSENFRNDSTASARFLREIHLCARLNHPNIVTIYDADESKGVLFFAMEYVQGRDLHDIVREEGPLTFPQALDCVIQAARGFGYAHNAGIIHRDIKPGNLLLDDRGVVKILDMGLAGFNQQFTQDQQMHLTMPGIVLGTVDFMAPEQAMDSTSVDSRSDIYSLGCTLFYVLAGRPVYKEDNVMKLLLSIRDAAIPSIRDFRPELPAELDSVFQRMLAKDPADRFDSMDDVIAALSPFLGDSDEGTR